MPPPRHALSFTCDPSVELSVLRLPATAALPAWAVDALAAPAPAGGLVSATRTREELSLILPTAAVPPSPPPTAAPPAALSHEPGWAALAIDMGPLPFGLTGVLLAALGPLADAGVGIFATSTFNTDWVLVKAAQLPAAVDALRGAGHTVDVAGGEGALGAAAVATAAAAAAAPVAQPAGAGGDS